MESPVFGKRRRRTESAHAYTWRNQLIKRRISGGALRGGQLERVADVQLLQDHVHIGFQNRLRRKCVAVRHDVILSGPEWYGDAGLWFVPRRSARHAPRNDLDARPRRVRARTQIVGPLHSVTWRSIPCGMDPWLCVPPLRMVCLCRGTRRPYHQNRRLRFCGCQTEKKIIRLKKLARLASLFISPALRTSCS